MLRLQLLRSF
ncbi:hypothetical protein MTR67_034769 [Solanum verrucosum]|uniref:Uncharacterized protein n=1 Tax=Solanum verrucosum TaxID=315347 RepID=A0AAF0U957_SOLVR|nr:hypothetical protein MTR67_034769 [Solanum verrucosum]